MNQSLAAFKRWRIQIFALTWLAYAVGQFTWGMLADRFGPRVVLFFFLQHNKPEDVGLPAVEPEPQSMAPAGNLCSVWAPLREILRNRTVMTLGLAYFLLKPARYAILLWGPVIVFEQMPSVGPNTSMAIKPLHT